MTCPTARKLLPGIDIIKEKKDNVSWYLKKYISKLRWMTCSSPKFFFYFFILYLYNGGVQKSLCCPSFITFLPVARLIGLWQTAPAVRRPGGGVIIPKGGQLHCDASFVRNCCTNCRIIVLCPLSIVINDISL